MYTPLLTKPRPIKRPSVEEVAPQPAGITQSRAGGPLAKRPRLKESHSGTSSGTRDVPTLSITSSPTLSITSSPTLSITSSAAQQLTASKCSHPQSTSNARQHKMRGRRYVVASSVGHCVQSTRGGEDSIRRGNRLLHASREGPVVSALTLI